MPPEDTMTISVKEYKRLKKRSLKLQALEDGGVDNWEWYDESMQSYRDQVEAHPDDQDEDGD